MAYRNLAKKSRRGPTAPMKRFVDLETKNLNSEVIKTTKDVLLKHLEEFKNYSGEEIVEQRKNKFLKVGKQKSFNVFSKDINWIKSDNFFTSAKEALFKFRKELIIVFILVLVSTLFLI